MTTCGTSEKKERKHRLTCDGMRVRENTGQSSGRFGLVTFGSSFNVCDREKALEETARILKPGGWFACVEPSPA